MIYTVTLNPSLDCHLALPALETGKTNRALHESLIPGGKGLNVSTVLTRLNVPNVALGFVAGCTGKILCRELSQLGIVHDMIPLREGMTRINVKLHGDQETEINAPGPSIDEQSMEALMHKLSNVKKGDTLVLSGSLPPSLPKNTYASMLSYLENREMRCVVDAEGEALSSTLPYRPFLVKPNLSELTALVGRPLLGNDDILAAAMELRDQGAQNVLVSLGKDGALLLDQFGKIHTSPAVGGRPVSTVGAGDSMVAGFLAGLSDTFSFSQAFRLGIAAGGATACSDSICTAEQIYTLFNMM